MFRKRDSMTVGQLMTRGPKTCALNDSLSRAAQILWENDCGCVPVTDAAGKAIAMITDRDICMAAFTQDKPLSQMVVSAVASRNLATVREDDRVEIAEAVLRDHRVRRVPVVDESGRLTGVLSINDLARHISHRRRDLDGFVGTMATIGEPPARRAAAE
jgi:CBS domain-containing protein